MACGAARGLGVRSSYTGSASHKLCDLGRLWGARRLWPLSVKWDCSYPPPGLRRAAAGSRVTPKADVSSCPSILPRLQLPTGKSHSCGACTTHAHTRTRTRACTHYGFGPLLPRRASERGQVTYFSRLPLGPLLRSVPQEKAARVGTGFDKKPWVDGPVTQLSPEREGRVLL